MALLGRYYERIADHAVSMGRRVIYVVTGETPEGTARTGSGIEVTTHGGRKGTGIDAIEWARRGEELGVGEILLNSMDADGTKAGFDLRMIAAARAAVHIPVIASGGAGHGTDCPASTRRTTSTTSCGGRSMET